MLKEEIYYLIRNDWVLRNEIGQEIGVSESTIYKYAQRKSPKLEHYLVVKKLMNHTGKKDKDLFEKI